MNVRAKDSEDKEELEPRETPGLDDFKLMLLKCEEKSKEKFSYIISDEYELPKKPKGDRKQWKLAYLSDGKTRRRFVFVDILYKGIALTAIEIERDRDKNNHLKSKPTLLLKRLDGSKIIVNEIKDIVRNLVKYNRRWLYEKDGENFDYYTFVEVRHPIDSKENNIKEWAKRFLKAIKNLE